MITSLTSPKIVRVRRLLETHSPNERRALGEFVVEGLRSVSAVVENQSSLVIEIFALERWLKEFPTATLISEDVAARVSETISSQGIFAVVRLPPNEVDLETVGDISIFIELQDPGNAGTVIRSAHAFGLGAVVMTKGSVDPFSAKVVRASTGSLASIPIVIGEEIEGLIGRLAKTHELIAFDMNGKDIRQFKKSRPVAMIFGNEARGLPNEVLEEDSVTKLKIPMVGKVESLNVASAATIAMFEISQPGIK